MTKQQITNLIGAGTVATILLVLALVFGGSNRIGNGTGQTVVLPNSNLTEQINAASGQLGSEANSYGATDEMEAKEMEMEEDEQEEDDD